MPKYASLEHDLASQMLALRCVSVDAMSNMLKRNRGSCARNRQCSSEQPVFIWQFTVMLPSEKKGTSELPDAVGRTLARIISWDAEGSPKLREGVWEDMLTTSSDPRTQKSED